MLHRFKLLVLKNVLLVLAGDEAEVFAHELLQIAIAVRGARKDLYPVAGGDDHALLDAAHRGKFAESLRQTRLGDGKALPHFHRRRLMIYAQYKKVHGAMNLCSLLR
jgi:hypothetical protein